MLLSERSWSMIPVLRRGAGCVLACVLVGSGGAQARQASVPGSHATPWVGEMGIFETVDQIMERESLLPAIEVRPAIARREHDGPDRSGLPQNPESPRVSRWPIRPPGHGGELDGGIAPGRGGGAPRTPQAVGLSFLAASLSQSGFVPPDSFGDVSPTQILMAANGRIRVFDKTGAGGALNASTDNFFNSVRAGSGTSDPRVRYDRLSGRWFVLMINVSSPNRILLAVSNTGTITGSSGFTFFQFQQDLVTPAGDTGLLADYPSLGVDANAIYTGANMFGTTYQRTTGWVIRKSSVLGAGPIVVTAFRGLAPTASATGPYAPRGVNNDDPASTEGYFIGTDNASFGRLILRRVFNPGGSPTISGNIALTVPATTGPLPVPALGSAEPLDAINDRLFSADMHLDRVTGVRTLWTAHHFQVDSNGVASDTSGWNGSRWYQIGNLGGTPTLVQAGTLYDTAPNGTRNFWFPTAAMSGQGHMALGCSVAGVSEFASIAVAGRLAGEPPGAIGAPTTAVASASSYNVLVIPPGPFQRWGDYSNTAVDPSDDMTMWTFQEYCDDIDSWGVRVVQLLAPPPATPSQAVPSCVGQGAGGVNVLVYGTSVAGSGFFDPEPAYPKHITALIDETGVTIDAVQWIDPTRVVLTLTVAPDAALGPRTITIVNPDGQAMASAPGILSIGPGPYCAPDFNCDGFVDGIDYDTFNNLFAVGDPAADYNGDGFVDGIDYDTFNNDFDTGC